MAKTAALELGRDNIGVNSIHPGVIRTPVFAESDAAAVAAATVRGLAIPRMAEPEEITRLVLFVASSGPFQRCSVNPFRALNDDSRSTLNRNAVVSSSPGLPPRLPWDHG